MWRSSFFASSVCNLLFLIHDWLGRSYYLPLTIWLEASLTLCQDWDEQLLRSFNIGCPMFLESNYIFRREKFSLLVKEREGGTLRLFGVLDAHRREEIVPQQVLFY